MKLPPVHDIARLLRPRHEDTVQQLVQYFTEGGGVFNYSYAQSVARYVFQGSARMADIEAACQQLRPAAARRPNLEVLQGIHLAGKGRKVSTYSVKPKVLGVRRDMAIPIAPTFAFVEDGIASMHWVQPRRYHALSLSELALLASIFQRGYMVDDFDGLGLEILDLSVDDGDKERGNRAYRLTDLTLLTDQQVDLALSRFLAAFDEVSAMGVKKRPRRKQKRRDDDLSDDLFGSGRDT